MGEVAESKGERCVEPSQRTWALIQMPLAHTQVLVLSTSQAKITFKTENDVSGRFLFCSPCDAGWPAVLEAQSGELSSAEAADVRGTVLVSVPLTADERLRSVSKLQDQRPVHSVDSES